MKFTSFIFSLACISNTRASLSFVIFSGWSGARQRRPVEGGMKGAVLYFMAVHGSLTTRSSIPSLGGEQITRSVNISYHNQKRHVRELPVTSYELLFTAIFQFELEI